MKFKKHVLLIGATGGLGSATAKLLSKNGWHVFAADVQQNVIHDYKQIEHVTPLLIDITNSESIEKAFKLISSHTTGLNAVIHMAGTIKIGSLAELPISDLTESLDINLLGVYRVNRQFLPLILQGKGRIIMLSSEVGKQMAAPFNGIYSISKHALEAYSDALRRELAFLGIKVIKIQPGPFRTDMTKNVEQLFIEAQKNSSYFKKNLGKGIPYLPKVYRNAHDPALVAQTILKALESASPKTAYSVKTDTTRMLLDLLPVKWTDKLMKKILS